jgi:hypothetical protein
MNNIGTVSTFQSLMFFAFFMLPLVLLAFRSLVVAFYRNTVYIDREVPVEIPVEVPVYVKNTVFVERPVSRKNTNRKNNNKKVETSVKIKKDVLEALKGIGLSANEARTLISKTIGGKSYKSSQQLLKDCIANM